MWWKKYQRKIIVSMMIAAVLAAAFTIGRGTPAASPVPDASAGTSYAEEKTALPAAPKESDAQADSPERNPELSAPPEAASAPEAVVGPSVDTGLETGQDPHQTVPVPEDRPLPVEPQDTAIGSNTYTCTISISCATILDHMDLCEPDKAELVPVDGWILEPLTVTFYEGESVFDVLLRTCQQQKIHMEYEDTPIYNSAYIEGIHNLYEFDVGELSGWMYAVNDWFPNYGCSRYQLQDGDVVCWVYTCDLGSDVGGGYSTSD